MGAIAGSGPDTAPRAAGGLVLIAAVAVGATLIGRWAAGRNRRDRPQLPPAGRPAQRGLHAAAAMLSVSVLADSGLEHYRGAFENPGMYTPLATAALSLAAGADGATGRRLPAPVRNGCYGLAGMVGLAGVGFHLSNLLRRPGGLNWINLFYAAPPGAPAALSLAGLLGLAATRLEAAEAPHRLLGLPPGRALSALTSAGLLGTVAEVGLLHFRGSFQNPFMWLPVVLPPVSAAMMAKAAVEPGPPRRRPLTRAWLAITAVLGVAGVGFHAFGVSRAMGGWRNWSQNLIDGPPLPAPPSFSALALAALSALALRRSDDDALRTPLRPRRAVG